MAISTATFAQENRFSISFNSLTTNFNYGSLNKELKSHKKDFKGLQIGASYQAAINPHFSLVPELYFAMKGGILKENNGLTNNRSTIRLYSVEMPVLARLHLHRFYLNAGPYAAYTLGGRLKLEGTEETPGSSTKLSFGTSPGEFKRWDAGVQAGVGYNFKVKSTHLTLDARYGYGFVTISNDVKRYNRLLAISLVVSKRPRNQTEKKG
ncbi:PorT family protein [Larkinella rosea]|uniref:PorT family protein n=2 Tax=Larkinella rosea TaxID=2025312 RepID=A0A3P1BUH2_9BACT|nr:PorT family protein [Larkinella rosea]